MEYKKYKELQLTEKGTKKALLVIRKHRLWEAFLHKTFDMSLHDIHREAELLEHETSDFLANKISEYLGNPKFDPHGDPIPNASGEIVSKDTSVSLSAATACWAKKSLPNMPAKAVPANPPPACQKNSRRVRPQKLLLLFIVLSSGYRFCIQWVGSTQRRLVQVEKFVEVECDHTEQSHRIG